MWWSVSNVDNNVNNSAPFRLDFYENIRGRNSARGNVENAIWKSNSYNFIWQKNDQFILFGYKSTADWNLKCTL